MATNRRDVQLAVKITTAGESEIGRLAAQVRALGQEGGAAGVDLSRVADALDQVAAQAAEIDAIKRLAEDFDRLKTAQETAAQAAQRASESYRDQAGVVAKLREAEALAREEARRSKEARDDLSRTLAQARA